MKGEIINNKGKTAFYGFQNIGRMIHVLITSNISKCFISATEKSKGKSI